MARKMMMTLIAAATLATVSLSASACFTVIVGKDASATGEILVGHNEDNDQRIMMSQYWVPAADHQVGEMITYEPSAAKIPQVGHTYGYYWTQTLAPGGYSFSDGFVNEHGVTIVSNNCNETYEKHETVKDGGVGYGIRRLMAERAKSAREAVDVAIGLVEKYGYFQEGRTYHIADHNEAWQLALLKGHLYAARRVKDNEVTYIANAFSLETLDANDKDVILAPGLIEHAIELGRYKPLKAGDYSDFNFRKAYQPKERRAADWNKDRSATALRILTGTEGVDEEAFPVSVVPKKKLTVNDVKEILRGHWAHEKRESGWFHQSMRDICNIGTQESSVFEMNADPMLTLVWRTTGRPCQSPYVPMYPLAKPSAQMAYMDWQTATKEHFTARGERFDFKPDLALFTFITVQNLVDYLGSDKELKETIATLERGWAAKQGTIEERAKTLKRMVNEEKALRYLHQYNANSYDIARSAIGRTLSELNSTRVWILADTLSLSLNGMVDVVVFGSDKLNAAKLDVKTAKFGVAYSNEDVDLNTNYARAAKMAVKDVDGDGRADAVLTFPVKQALYWTTPNMLADLYLYGVVDGKKIAGFDTVRVVK